MLKHKHKELEEISESSSSTGRMQTRFILWLLLAAILATWLILTFNEVRPAIEQTRLTSAIGQFRDSVNQIHIAWLWSGKPARIFMPKADGFDSSTETWEFIMNRQGWPVAVATQLEREACDVLWETLQASDFQLESEALNVSYERERVLGGAAYFDTGICQYQYEKKILFYFNAINGKIELGEYGEK